MVQSAGLLIFNTFDNQLKVLLAHPGGPYWENRKEEGWGIPKGKMEEGEDVWDTAVRETQEEIGQLPTPIPPKVIFNLGSVKQSSKKTVHCFAIQGDVEKELKSMMITMEHPKGSGEIIEVPEIGEMKWFTPEEARLVIIHKQYAFIERLMDELNESATA